VTSSHYSSLYYYTLRSRMIICNTISLSYNMMLRTPPKRCCRRELEAICHLSFARSFLLVGLISNVASCTYYTLIHYYTHTHIILLYCYIIIIHNTIRETRERYDERARYAYYTLYIIIMPPPQRSYYIVRESFVLITLMFERVSHSNRLLRPR